MSFNNGKSNVIVGIFAATGAGLAPISAWAAEAQAITGRLEAFGGSVRDERPLDGSKNSFSGGVLPSVGFRLNNTIMLQIDGMAAEHRGDGVYATAAHLGFKAADNLSVGLYSSYSHFKSYGGLDTYRLGAEAAYNAGRITVSGIAGFEHSDRTLVTVAQGAGFSIVDSYGKGGAFFSMADVSMYLDDDWSVTAGHRYVGGRHAAVLGTEKAIVVAGNKFSIFAEGRLGSQDYKVAWVGIRFRFGASGSSLITRDRGDGYANRLKDELFTIGNTRSRSQVGTVVTPPVVVPPVVVPPVVVEPPAPPPSDGGSCCGACYSV